MHDTLISKLPFNEDVPQGLKDIIYKSVAFHPNDRYQTAEEMLRDLKELQKDPRSRFSRGGSNKLVSVKKSRRDFLLMTLGYLPVAAWSIYNGSRESDDRRRSPSPSSQPSPTSNQPTKKTLLSWAELQDLATTNVDHAIQKITEEIALNSKESEIGRSYFYRARLLIQKAEGLDSSKEKETYYKNALQDLIETEERLPEKAKDPRFQFLRGFIQLRLGNYQEMETLFNKALDLIRSGKYLTEEEWDPQEKESLLNEIHRLLRQARLLGLISSRWDKGAIPIPNENFFAVSI